jgi:hypothetical protein
MKRWLFIITIGLLGLTACTTFYGVTAINPKAGHPYNPTKVENLQPTLKWKSPTQADVTYDIIIFEGITTDHRQGTKRAVGKMVYYRERIKETYHKVEDPLEPDKEYYWSVRVREGDKVTEWSRYDYFLYGVVAYVKGNNLWFMFKTPKK